MERDYREQGWGHACTLQRKAGPEDNLFRGMIFGDGIEVGDTILLKMKSGKIAIFQIDELTWSGEDPGDQYFIESGHFTGYKE